MNGDRKTEGKKNCLIFLTLFDVESITKNLANFPVIVPNKHTSLVKVLHGVIPFKFLLCPIRERSIPRLVGEQ